MSILAIPRAVTLGGRHFMAAEFRVADLLTLEAWAADQTPDPFEAAAFDLYHAPRDKGWKRHLGSVLDAVEAAGATHDAYQETPEGIAQQVLLCLQRGNPATTEAEVAAALAAGAANPLTTEAEVGRILRIAWGVTSLDAIRGLIDGPQPSVGRTDWPLLWYRYGSTMTGPGPRFEEMSLTQLRAWLNEGQDPDAGSGAIEKATARAEFWEDVWDLDSTCGANETLPFETSKGVPLASSPEAARDGEMDLG